MNYCVECQPQQKSCETCKFWENINCPDCINDSGEMDCYIRGESCHNCGRIFERREEMYDISIKIGEICNKPQEYADMVNELLVLFKDCQEQQKRKLQDEINQLKEQHAEDLEKCKSQLRDWQDGFVGQCEREKHDIEAKYTNLQDEYERLHYEYKGYRQAVKNILGGTE